MRKSLIISIVWLWATWAFGQCGSAANTDLDGPYVSSTSSDKCSGHIGPLGESKPLGLQRHLPYRTYESSFRIQALSFDRHDTVRLIPPLVLVEQFNQMHDADPCLPFSALHTVRRPRFIDRKIVLRAALERGWQ